MTENENITLTKERAEGNDPENNIGTDTFDQNTTDRDNTAVSDEKDDAVLADREEYNRLIKTKYKDFYTEDTQRMINRRFRHYKEIEEKLKAFESEKAMLNERKALSKEELIQKVKDHESELRSQHPDFVLDDLHLTDSFLTLARVAVESGEISLSQAYKLSHFDRILKAEIEKAEKKVEQRMIGELRSRRARPYENAVSPRRENNAFDITKLTKDERAQLAARAAKGEKIHF